MSSQKVSGRAACQPASVQHPFRSSALVRSRCVPRPSLSLLQLLAGHTPDQPAARAAASPQARGRPPTSGTGTRGRHHRIGSDRPTGDSEHLPQAPCPGMHGRHCDRAELAVKPITLKMPTPKLCGLRRQRRLKNMLAVMSIINVLLSVFTLSSLSSSSSFFLHAGRTLPDRSFFPDHAAG